jgi:hypothetical protein
MSQVVIGDIIPYTQAIAILNQTVFGTNWTANVASDVVVYQTPFGDDPDDVTQILQYPADYSIAFIGASEEVQVTLVVPAGAGDRITIIRNTPADRMNLYSNTNFTPSMLNNDFGILTLVDQQAQLVDQKIGPRYNYSAVIVNVVDTILPVLPALSTWWKNANNDAIETYILPEGGVAPAVAEYVLLSPNAYLTNAQALSDFGVNGLMAWNNGLGEIVLSSVAGTANQITVTNPTGATGTIGLSISNNPIMPGTAGMGIPEGTTAQRVVPGSNISFRYNTDLGQLEFYDGGWVQLADTSVNILAGAQYDLAYYASAGTVLSPLGTANDGILATDGSGAPSITSTLPSAVQLNITQLGTITAGVWNGTAIGPVYGGTGLTSYVLGDTLYASAANTLAALAGNTTAVKQYLSQTGTGAVSAAPAWATIDGGDITGAELSKVDDTNVTLTLGGTPLTALLRATSLTLGWTGQLAVPRGGTGNSTFTAYSVICAGTTDTGAFQNVSGVGAAGEVLTSNGAGFLPTWQTSAGSGTVNASTQNYIAYYAANGNTVSGLATVNNGVLVTDGSGVPSFSTTLPSGLTIPGYQTTITPAALTKADDTNVTLTLGGSPSTSLLAATSLTLGWTGQLGLTRGGTAASLTASNGGIVYSDASALAILSGTATAGLALLSGASGAPSWSTSPPITKVVTQTITTTGAGTYTPTTGMKYCIIELQGAGGGSGGTTGAGGQGSCSGGGGGGCYAKIIATAAQIGASASYTVGAAGTAGASGNNAGGNGGDTEITIGGGTTWEANGGVGGGGQTASAAAQDSGTPGTAGTFVSGTNATLIFAMQGSNASTGSSPAAASLVNRMNSIGGASFLGRPQFTYNAAGYNYGGGAAGFQNQTGANAAGSAGAQGIIMITEFISA